MKKLTCFLLVFCLLCSMVPALAAEPAFAGGDGSPEDPYQIATLEQLETFRDLVNAGNESICAKLVDDIVINEDPAASIRDGKEDELITFAPIGTDAAVFNGVFSGNGYTITGLYFNEDLYSADPEEFYYYALFGHISFEARIVNLTLDKIYLSGTATNSGSILLAGLVAQSEAALDGIFGCSVSGNIFASSAKGDLIVGGFCGLAPDDNKNAYFEQCENYCDITVKTADGSVFAGGISGYNGYAKNCTNYGSIQVSLLNQTVSDNDNVAAVGGIVGYTENAPAFSYNLHDITVNVGKDNYTAIVGGIGGYVYDLSSSIYNLGNITVVGGNASAGGCHGYGGTINSYNKGSIFATCTANEAYALAGGLVANDDDIFILQNLHNYGNVTANGKRDSVIGAAGIAARCGNTVENCYNLGAITASGNNDALVDAITVDTATSSAFFSGELYSLKWIAPINNFYTECTELTQAEFKTLWADETHPEWDYAPVFDDVLYQETPFSDTNPLSWYYDATVYAYTNDLMQGMSMTKFEPNLAMTRAMLVTVLYRMAGSPDVSAMENPFPDIPADTWYTDAVIWAANNNIVKGYQEDGNFHPTWDITREQIASILYRYVTEYLGETAGVFGDLSTFPDSNSVSEYARESIAWATGEGLITGTREGDQVLLDPRGLATRAQIATILMRFCQNDAE